MKDERKEVEKNLIESFLRWEYLYTHGGRDPFWEDGINLNLVRNHILSYRMQLEALKYFPEIYSREIPPEVDNLYMARKDEIREHARQSLTRYKEDENLRYLMENAYKVTEKQSKEICLNNVLGYLYNLEDFIKRDSLVEMRRHENPERFLERLRSCREKLEKILAEKEEENQLVIIEEQSGQLRFA